MNMNSEQEFGLFIRQHLNAGLTGFERPATERLFEARQKALARYSERHAQKGLALAGHNALTWMQDSLRPFLLAVGLVSLLAAGHYIMSLERIAEIEEVDSALLADDLPIDAYLDKGFDKWLSDSSER